MGDSCCATEGCIQREEVTNAKKAPDTKSRASFVEKWKQHTASKYYYKKKHPAEQCWRRPKSSSFRSKTKHKLLGKSSQSLAVARSSETIARLVKENGLAHCSKSSNVRNKMNTFTIDSRATFQICHIEENIDLLYRYLRIKLALETIGK